MTQKKTEISALQTEISDLSKKIDAQKKEIAEFKTSNLPLLEKHMRLKNEQKESETKISKLTSEINALEQKLNELMDAQGKANALINELTSTSKWSPDTDSYTDSETDSESGSETDFVINSTRDSKSTGVELRELRGVDNTNKRQSNPLNELLDQEKRLSGEIERIINGRKNQFVAFFTSIFFYFFPESDPLRQKQAALDNIKADILQMDLTKGRISELSGANSQLQSTNEQINKINEQLINHRQDRTCEEEKLNQMRAQIRKQNPDIQSKEQALLTLTQKLDILQQAMEEKTQELNKKTGLEITLAKADLTDKILEILPAAISDIHQYQKTKESNTQNLNLFKDDSMKSMPIIILGKISSACKKFISECANANVSKENKAYTSVVKLNTSLIQIHALMLNKSNDSEAYSAYKAKLETYGDENLMGDLAKIAIAQIDKFIKLNSDAKPSISKRR